MPSPKAVLRDINDMGLDPTKPWVCNKAGHLHPTPRIVGGGPHYTLHGPTAEKAAEAEKPAPNALKELPKKVEAKKVEVAPPPPPPPPPAPEPVVEAKDEEPVVEEVIDDSAADDVAAPTGKKSKKAKASS